METEDIISKICAFLGYYAASCGYLQDSITGRHIEPAESNIGLNPPILLP
jgi:hypothetical protein